MIEKTKSIDNILPYGEALRSFCVQPFISKSDLNKFLRRRGIFINQSEKKDSIPIILSLLNSPTEFDHLKECQAVAEDNPKHLTRTIQWASNSTLVEALSGDIKLNKMAKDEFSNYKIIGTPNFVPVKNNPDKVRCEYEIERTDNSRNYFSAKERFKGAMEFEKVVKNNQVNLALTYTSAETKIVNQKLTKGITSYFKDKGHIQKDAVIKKILLSDFTNAQRIKYLWALIGAVSDDEFAFANDIHDIGFRPDSSLNYPSDIKWMEEKVNSMKLQGRDLQNTFFINDKEYHQYFIFGNIDAKYDFDLENIKGSCIISFSFPGYLKNNNAELEVNVVALNLVENKRNWSRNHSKGVILKRIEEHKITEYENIFSSDTDKYI